MSIEVLCILIIAGALLIVVGLNIIARTDTGFGKFVRWFINIGYRIWSKVPMMGWMAHLIIAKTPAERAMKARCINSTNQIQDFYGGQINAVAQRQQEEAAREEEIRRVMSREGLNTTSISADGNSATGTDKYGNTHHININWK